MSNLHCELDTYGKRTLNWELPLLDWPGRMSGGALPWLLIGAGGFTVGGTNLMQTRPRLCKKDSWICDWEQMNEHCGSVVQASVLAQIPALTFFLSVTEKPKPNKPSPPSSILSGIYDSNRGQTRISSIVFPNSYSIYIRLLPDLLHNCSIFILPGSLFHHAPHHSYCTAVMNIFSTFGLANYCSISLSLHSCLRVA